MRAIVSNVHCGSFGLSRIGLALAAVLALPVSAGAVTWEGTVSSNWADANWDSFPNAGDPLVFSASGQSFRPTNNNIVGGEFNGLTFNADSFTGGGDVLTISGNSFELGGNGIVASAIGVGRTVDVQNDIVLTANSLMSSTQANSVLLLSGDISGAFQLQKASTAGTVRLTGNSSFTGGVTWSGGGGGILEFTSVADTGTNSALGSQGTIGVRPTARYVGTDPGGHSTNRSVQFNSGGSSLNNLEASGVGPLTLTGTVGFGAARNAQLSGTGEGVITGVLTANGGATFSLVKAGAGTWTLGGTSNNNVARARVQSGTLIVAKNNALGTGTANEALVDPGATLAFQANIDYSTATPVRMSGTGDAGNGQSGAIANISGMNSFAGDITLAGDTTFGADAGQLTLSGLVDDEASSFALTKNGPGTIVLASSTGNTYDGGTVINQGMLVAGNSSGSATGSGGVEVNSGGTLAGGGIVGGDVSVNSGGAISPGDSPGALVLGSGATLAGGSSYTWEINDWQGDQGLNYDHLDVTAALDITATQSNPFTLAINTLTSSDVPGLAEGALSDMSWIIATAAGGISGLTADNWQIDTSGVVNPLSGAFSLSVSGNDLLLNFAVPEPSTFAMLGLGAVLLMRRRRRRTAT